MIKKKTQNISHLLRKVKKILLDKFNIYMKENKATVYTQTKRLLFDWSDEKTV